MQKDRKSRLLKSTMAVSLVFLILSTPTLTLGWGAGGHMIVAQIAFGRLSPNAKKQAKVAPIAITITTRSPS